ncbi:MAG: carboxypeptidase regulatory-like domain-containing protein [Chloroflexota bacterium]|nr:carboxypeptidase regulatory-like domain-containing protein [Chloroflexota bacterium]
MARSSFRVLLSVGALCVAIVLGLLASLPGVALAVATPAVGTPAVLAAPGTVSGVVRNAQTGAALSNVKVTLNGITRYVLTNQYGRYSMSSVEAGSRTLVFSKAGYVVLSKAVSVPSGGTAPLAAGLKPLAQLTGYVRDVSGRGVNGAVVRVANTSLVATTNVYGRYTLRNVPLGTRTVVTSKTLYYPASKTVSAQTGTTTTLGFGLTRKGTVVGKVTEAGTGKAIADAAVRVQVGSSTLSAITDTYGAYTLRGVPAGTYTLTASKGGYNSLSRQATVYNNKQIRADFQLSVPAAPGLALGAFVTGGPWDPAKLDEFSSVVGTRPSVVMWYQDWAHEGIREFDPVKMNAVTSRGAMPMVTWEPWDYTGGSDQPAYALRTIVGGQHDAYIRQWARDAAAWGQPMYVRWGHEMNAMHYPWAAGVNGNTSGEYVSAWQRIVGIFRAEGASNVRWVWAPNVQYEGTTPFNELYPGDAYVDWVGLDGYNGGSALPWGGWLSITQIFGSSHDALAAMTSKSMMISETGSAEAGGDKAAWIRHGLLDEVPTRLPSVRAVLWFHENKETDWRVTSSAATLAAYSEVAASARYNGRLP